MKPVYIIHPYRGNDNNFKENKQKIETICLELLKKGYLPISPVHMLSFLDEEKDPAVREKALMLCNRIMAKVHELDGVFLVAGDWRDSAGCLSELEFGYWGLNIEIFKLHHFGIKEGSD